eukprot:Anaeramoba_ignava/a607666_14.p1 GENE.a607666_14~~a607666_14.p1  ORF type:complete len:442 (-),score=88.30 a607666_14:73-1398(-)
MENMPAPKVKFKKKQIFSKPAKIKEPKIAPNFEQQNQTKKTINSIKKNLIDITPPTIDKVYKSLSAPPIKKSTATVKLKPKFDRPSRIVLKKSNELSNSVETLKKAFSLESFWNDVHRNFSEAQLKVAQAAKAAEDEENSEQDAEGEEESPKEIKGSDALFVKIKGLKKKEKWKEIKKLLSKNKEIAATPKGLEYMIEAELNSEKISYSKAKSAASKLLKSDKKNPLANYAMALYYYHNKKPKPKRVTKYLNLALKAKKPPAGASTLYWTIFLKKIWFIPLLLIAGIVGGIAHLKKKKTASLENSPAENEGESPTPESGEQQEPKIKEEPEIRPEGWKGKLFDLKRKVKPLIAKISQKLKKGSPKTKSATTTENSSETSEPKATTDNKSEPATQPTEADTTDELQQPTEDTTNVKEELTEQAQESETKTDSEQPITPKESA